MKKHYVKLIVTLLVLTALLGSTFMIGASAQTWEIESHGALEKDILKAEYYDGVMKLKIQKANAFSVGKLSDFMMSQIPWKMSMDYMEIKEVYFGTGIQSLRGIGMLYLDKAKIFHIPTAVTDLGELNRMLSLETIYYGGTEKRWNALTEGMEFTGFKKLTVIFESNDKDRDADESWEVGRYNESDVVASRVGDTLYLEGRGEMRDYKLTPNGYDDLAPWAMNNNIKHVIVCEGVRNVGDYAFWQNSTIEDVVISASVCVVGEEAFYGTSVSEIVVPASVTEIRKSAFDMCHKLSTVFLTQNLEKIGMNAFSGCEKLETINYGGSKYYWDKINIEDESKTFLQAKLVCNYVPEEKKGEDKPSLGGNNKDSSATEPPDETPAASAGESTPEPTAENKKIEKDHTAGTIVIISFSVVVALLVIFIVSKKKKNGKN